MLCCVVLCCAVLCCAVLLYCVVVLCISCVVFSFFPCVLFVYFRLFLVCLQISLLFPFLSFSLPDPSPSPLLPLLLQFPLLSIGFMSCQVFTFCHWKIGHYLFLSHLTRLSLPSSPLSYYLPSLPLLPSPVSARI